jgi:hypothetical protein
MMTRQARTSAVIMGLDTHMILGAVPVLLPDTPHRVRRHQPDITPQCRNPGVPGTRGKRGRLGRRMCSQPGPAL